MLAGGLAGTAAAAAGLAVTAHFPALPEGTGTSVVELARRHGDYAMCGVVAAVTIDPDARVAAARREIAPAGIGLSHTRPGTSISAGPSAGTLGALNRGSCAMSGVSLEDDVPLSAEWRALVQLVSASAAARDSARE